MNFLSGRGAEELTVYSWNTKVSAPLYLDEFDFFCYVKISLKNVIRLRMFQISSKKGKW